MNLGLSAAAFVEPLEACVLFGAVRHNAKELTPGHLVAYSVQVRRLPRKCFDDVFSMPFADIPACSKNKLAATTKRRGRHSATITRYLYCDGLDLFIFFCELTPLFRSL